MAATTVPTGMDPVLAIEKQQADNLSQRMSQMSNAAFKIANKQAQAKGTAFGALKAPTAEQIKLAKEAGKPITLADLPGDPGSISVAQQAASAGALAVVEDRLEMAGRKELTRVTLAAAADPDMTPQQFGAAIDDVVQSYTQAMNNISPGSAAKVSASLAMVANSQAVSFSRSYSTASKKRTKDEALENVNDIIGTFPSIIQGHVPKGPGNPDGVKLADKLDLTRLRSMLENAGHNETKIKSVLSRAQTEISKAKVAAVSEWANSDEFATNPTGAMRAMAQGKMPAHLKEIWGSMTDVERSDARKAINDAASGLNRAIEIEINREKFENEQLELDAERRFNDAYSSNNKAAMDKAIEDMDTVDPGKARDMRTLQVEQAGALADNEEDIKKLDELRARRILTIKDINEAQLTGKTKGDYISKLGTQTDALMSEAEAIAKGTLQPPSGTLSSKQLTEAERIARGKFTRLVSELSKARRKAERDGLPFDPIEQVETLLGKIDAADIREKRKGYESTVNQAYSFMPPELQNEAGLRKALTLKTDEYFSDFVFDTLQRYQIQKAINALEAMKELEAR